MARAVVLGAGISGHIAALYLRKNLGKAHEVIVISPNSNYQWVPSNIWVGVGLMKSKQVKFKLAPVYKRKNITYKQALAKTIFPEGDAEHDSGFVDIEYVDEANQGKTEKVTYDYLINGTGPKLNFAATEGLGPELNSQSVCTYGHAEHAYVELKKSFEKMKAGENQTFVIGAGHGMATCQGAAFEYALNIAFEINKQKLNDKAEIVWITNEYEVGDFGLGGAYVKRSGYITSTKVFAESILKEYGIRWITQAAVQKVEKDLIHYETLDGEMHSQAFDFSMLIPGFAGVGLKASAKNGSDITDKVFAANGLMKVDADYTSKNFEDWSPKDWPSIYQSPVYENIYAPGIAFATPHGISKPMKSPNGTPIYPTAPRTGMPSGVIGKIVAQNIAIRIKTGTTEHKHRASMSKMGAACVVSGGYGIKRGTAATMTVFPIVQNWEKYPKWGRDIRYTVGEAGLAGHWMKLFMHYMFLYKAKAKFGWSLIPE
ncbi:MAG: FAD-dependent oxidoreductase [Bacteroidota bacterium]|nr:FAD-dependent oxidoreductase [Bacteroidota bacterium]